MVERCQADALAQTQRPREAALILQRVLADQRALDTDETHRVRVALSLLAKALLLGGRVVDAATLFGQALALHERLSGAANDEGVAQRTWLGLVCALRGDGAGALGHLDHAEAHLGAREEPIVLTRNRGAARALALAEAGRHPEALALADALLGPPTPQVGTIAVRLLRVRALALRELGSAADACAAADQALTAVDAVCSALEHGLALAEAAHCSLTAGRESSAQAQWREALSVWERGQVDGSELHVPVRARIQVLPVTA